jgi:hypothetical protein
MTLNNVRPATINSTKLLAFVLFAIGIAIFAYFLADEGILRRPPIASTTAWAGGFVLLALDGRKRRAEQTTLEQLPRSQPPSSPRRGSRPSTTSRRHTSPAAEYTHQTSHF